MMKAFDAPRREECTAERPISNTPNAALVLLNDPTFVESARVLAERIVAKKLPADDSIRLAFRLGLLRDPDRLEAKLLRSLYDMNLEIYKDNRGLAAELLNVGKHKPDGALDVARLAAFTQVARAVFNLDEFVTRR